MKIQKLLKVLLFVVLVAAIRAQEDEDDFDAPQLTNNEQTPENQEAAPEQEEAPVDAPVDEVTPLAPELEVLRTVIFINGKKVGRGDLQLKSMKESIAALSDIGTDLDNYAISHRGIVFKNLQVLDDKAKDATLRINDTVHIIPYRYLKSDFECTMDPFLGFACESYIKKGRNEDSFNGVLHLTFGTCCDGLEESELSSVESTIEILIQGHKDLLAEKIRLADEAAEEYKYYNNIYDDAVSKRNFVDEIPELEAKADEKQAECDITEQDFETAKADYDNEHALVNDNKDKINVLNSEIRSLSAKKRALEKEQIDVRAKTASHETRVNRLNEFSEDIEAAFQVIIQTIDPNFFDGRDCFKNGKVDSFCIDRLNKC